MIRDGILKTKRYELGDCRANHAQKLRELYFATVSLVSAGVTGGNDEFPKITEEEFLEANDISKGHYFDVNSLFQVGGELATLPQPSPTTPSEASPVEIDASQNGNLQASDAAGIGAQSSPVSTPQEEDGSSSTQRSSRSTQAGTPATRETVYGTEENALAIAAAKAQGDSRPNSGVAGEGDVDMSDAPVDDRSGLRRTVEAQDAPQLRGTERPDILIEPASKNQPISPPLQADLSSAKGLRPVVCGARPTHPSSPVTPITPDAQLQLEAGQASRRMSEVADSQAHTPAAENSSNALPSADAARNATASLKAQAQGQSENLSESKLAARRRAVSPDLRNSAMTKEGAKDLFLSQRPPMRIDTSIPYSSAQNQMSASATPSKAPQSAVQTSPPERMTTRVSSGVLRHKSVSEILGETPRSTLTPQAEHRRHASQGDELDSHSPRFAAQLAPSPESAVFKSRLQELKEKEKDRSKLSTVVFPKPQASGRDVSKTAMAERARSAEENKDYLVTLFTAQASAQVPTLDHLIKSAHKTLSTRDHYVDYREAQDCRILKRIYHLQNSNRWSLRQLERSAEPARPTSHWDNVLAEMKWMRTDFKEEKRWKVTVAKNLADWCTEWVASPAKRRTSLQVKARRPPSISPVPFNHITPVSLQVDPTCAISDSPPELVASADDDPNEETEEEMVRLDAGRSAAPATLFSLASDDVVFDLEKTPASEKILAELPMYQPFEAPRGVKRTRSEMMDGAWGKSIVPVSKFATGRLALPDREPERKRSRYDYADENEPPHDEPLLSTTSSRSPATLPPEQNDVALFNPENKHIVARLHAAHAFRPPSEFAMPSQSFFESRQPSQWTLAEDDELRRLVREHEYNWSLISNCLSSRSLFSSGAERRTPWECFERWVSFEGLPGDMARHQYFRAWNSRRENAKQHLEQLSAAQQQASNGQLPLRRRSSEPVGVERRRSNKYLAMINAMAKVAKKRETAIQKQQHVASLAQIRKAAEPPPPRQRLQTPREMSAHRYKVDCERRELYRQQLAATQRVAMAQKAVQQATHQQAAAAGVTVPRNGRPPSMGGGPPPHLSSLPPNALPPGQRPLSSSQPMMNGMLSSTGQMPNGYMGGRGPSSVQQAQMQALMQGQARVPSQGGQDTARMIMEASRLNEQQRLQAQRQLAAASGFNPPSSQNMANIGLPMQPSAAMMASAQAASGKLSPANGVGTPQPRPSSSPRSNNGAHAGSLSSGTVPVLNQIANQLRSMHPHASPDQIKQMATSHLSQSLRSSNPPPSMMGGGGGTANGMGAAGTNGMPQLSPQAQPAALAAAAAAAYGSPGMNSQLYAQYMRSQQASQQSRLGDGSDRGSLRPESRGATPAHGSRTSQSPHIPHAQMTGSS